MDLNEIRKYVIATAVVSIAIFGGVSIATEEELTDQQYCQQNFGDSSLLMELRQGNVENKSVAFQVAKSYGYGGDEKKLTILKSIIDEAFTYPVYHNYKKKQEVIANFNGLDTCLSQHS